MKNVIAVALLVFAAAPLAAKERTLAARAFPMPVPADIARIITDAARLYDVDPNLIAAMAFKESRFNPTAVSHLGAEGVMQLKPKTARYLGVTNSFDARQNIFGGTKYFRKLLDRFDGNLDLALAGYNAGPDRVAKEGPRATKEAVEYVAMVKDYYHYAARRAQ